MITQKDIKKLEENFPNKEELFTRLDALMLEVQTMREEMTVFAYRQGDHSDRIERLELDVFKKSFA